jgi:subtilisin family serine protease
MYSAYTSLVQGSLPPVPAAAEKAITVGASTLGDDRAYFFNHGQCVDIFAPSEHFH